ncbi:hypothetical protein ABIA22_004948 [Sinorhizobium fredii]
MAASMNVLAMIFFGIGLVPLRVSRNEKRVLRVPERETYSAARPIGRAKGRCSTLNCCMFYP